MKFSTVLQTLLLVSSTLAYSDVLYSWNENDLKNYLTDNSIEFKKKSSFKELQDLASKHWNDLQYSIRGEPSHWYDVNNLKQKALNIYQGRSINAPPKGSASDYYYTVKDWVFNSWTESDLKKLLDKSKIKYESHSTRDDLIKVAQDNYEKIAKSHHSSGNYLGDWLYESWDSQALKKWLDENDVGYSSFRDSRDDLLKKVREHSYEVSTLAEHERERALENLDLGKQSLFDKAGKIRDDVFNTWTSTQLYDWLKSHKVAIDDSIKTNKEELALLAQKNKDQFHKDVDLWAKKASNTISPYLSKSTEAADNLINETFLVGVENWSRDRLKSFLESRGIKPSFFSTRSELVRLVKANKYKPIKNFNSERFFEGWSKENVQKWISEQNDAIVANTKDFAEKTNDLYEQFVEGAVYYSSQASEAISNVIHTQTENVEQVVSDAKEKIDNAGESIHSAKDSVKSSVDESVSNAEKGAQEAKDAFFDYWSDVELTNYLKSFGVKPKRQYTRNELIKLAKQNTRWFITGAQYDAQSGITSAKIAGANFLNKVRYHLNNLYNTVYYTIFH
ncbi:hypothetical protein WICMUC_004660 [Wickerhamomyces mucosus]|uniref:Meiotic sister chromatid recombination protein 1 n=1 Tax=Wickerhamomyces mucosus TaxID=1378264 RepID=A0A9P8PFL1_9ASCO|nr:hypothetical protein WICMUC_004660 [Wickerhamomyces mucosus]